jgi:Spy/CpxP family protein refolding chaperone
MTRKLFSIGATVSAVALAAAFVVAQGATGSDQGQTPPPVVQGQTPPPGGQAQPPLGRGRMLGQGRGQGQGLGPGQGQGLGPGPGRNMQAGPQGRQGRGGPMMGRGRGPGGLGLNALDLNDDQRTAITNLQRAERDQSAPMADELQFTQKTLQRELFADKRDSAKIATLTAKVATLEKQLMDLRVKTATSIADVLTPKQRETMRLRDGRGGGPRAGIGLGPGPRRGR